MISVYSLVFVTVFLGYNQYWPGGFMVLWLLCPGAGSGSGIKASQKTGPWSDPCLQDIGLSPTPWRISVYSVKLLFIL